MSRVPLLRAATAALPLVAWLAGCDAADGPSPSTAPASPAAPAAAAAAPRKLRVYEYEPVGANPEASIPDGFRGDVHPELAGMEPLTLVARWEPTLAPEKRGGIELGVIDNAAAPRYSIPADLVAVLTESRPAVERAQHDARVLSALLPQELGAPGQTWRIEPEAAAGMLAQFHPGVATGFDRYHQPYGRRPGPPGAFGLLRAVSADHAEVLFRVHAELVLAEGALLYTPACFLGRMLVDRRARTVTAFEMGVPTALGINLNITVTFPLPSSPDKEVTNIVFEHVDPMRLAGGDLARFDAVRFESEIERADAELRLKRAFYKFLDVDWVPLEDALDVAEREDKPIVVVVLTSPLDDQSC